MADIEKAVQAYRDLREKKEEIQTRHKDELAPINSKMWELEMWLLAALNKQGAESIKTNSGTVFVSTTMTAKVEDWDALLDKIKEDDLWHLLEKRVSKTAVKEYVDADGTTPPGVSVNYDRRVNIRKPSN